MTASGKGVRKRTPAPVGLDESVLGIAAFDENLKLTSCNEALSSIHGYPAALCRPGVDIAEFFRFEQGRLATNRGGSGTTVESRVARVGESQVSEFETEAGRLHNVHYQPLGGAAVVLVARDVTEYRLRVAELKESQTRYALLEQAATEGIYEWHIEESMLDASPRLRQIFGFDCEREGFTKWNWNERVHPEDFERYRAALRDHFKGRTEAFECEYRARDEAGVYRWILDRGVCVRDDAGRAVRLIGAINDLTDHNRRETELAEKTTILESTLENMDQGITMVDQDLRVIAFNRKFLDLLDLPPERFKLGYHMEEAFRYNAERGEYGPGDVEQQVQERLALARRFEPHHFERVRPEGTVIEIHGTPLPGKRGFVTTYTDVTSLKRAERELAEKEAQLRVALDNMPGGMTLIDKEQRYVFFNRQYVALHDFPDGLLKIGGPVRDEAEFQADRGDFGPGDRKKLVEQALEVYRAAQAATLERTVPGGRVLQFYTAPTPDGGNATIVTDITDRKRAEQELLAHNERLREEIEAHRRSKATIEYLVDEIKSGHNFEEIVGESEPLTRVLGQLERVAATDSTVLIQGETGTGKELFVRAIHSLSDRRDRPLVKVNCAALPRDLVESELFGHEKGAFTGATQQRKGRFELADKGTLFLDEVGELPLETQAKLLRILQEQEFERVGGADTLHTDVRLIAATNRNLADEVEGGGFRSDLFYRLSVFPLTVPPLRQRRSDIPLLAHHFLGRYARKLGKRLDRLSPQTIATLMAYDWPGNVRELENVIERAAILSPGPLLELVEPLGGRPEVPVGEPEETATLCTLEDIERDHITRVLEAVSWVVEGNSGAGRILGLNPSTLRGRMRKLGIRKPR